MFELLRDIFWDRASGRVTLRFVCVTFCSTLLYCAAEGVIVGKAWGVAGFIGNLLATAISSDKADPPPKEKA